MPNITERNINNRIDSMIIFAGSVVLITIISCAIIIVSGLFIGTEIKVKGRVIEKRITTPEVMSFKSNRYQIKITGLLNTKTGITSETWVSIPPVIFSNIMIGDIWDPNRIKRGK